jgi:dTDP-4-dehydrorhamnose reductase
MQPRILIIGKNGQVGYELCRTLAPVGQVTAIDFPEIDLTRPESIRDWIARTAPAVIVNAAAYTAVDKAETETERCRQINSVAPGLIAQAARETGALVVHYSTDYVYEGTKQSAYVEEDAPNPLSSYGRSKLDGDLAVISSGADHLIFRLCWVYGGRGQNFMLTMMRLAREREKLRVVSDQFGAPTWSRMIAETTALALCRVLASPDRARFNGVYHLAASGHTSWQGFASAIIDLMPAAERKCSVVEPIPTSEYPLPAKRPARSIMSCAKLARTFGLQLPDWHDSLKAVLES